MADYREIPEGAVEIQTGLWHHVVERIIGGNTYRFGYLYSAPGYCFYNTTIEENYVDDDINGELLPPNQRMYAVYASVPISTDLSIFVSVVAEEGFDIVSNPNNPEIA